MRSQKQCPLRPLPWRARRLAGVLLLVLSWCLGQALALGHRLELGGVHAGHETHAVGGEHHEGDAQCRLVDQAGLGDALRPASLVLPPPAAPAAVAGLGDAGPTPAGQRRPYEARAPPRG